MANQLSYLLDNEPQIKDIFSRKDAKSQSGYQTKNQKQNSIDSLAIQSLCFWLASRLCVLSEAGVSPCLSDFICICLWQKIFLPTMIIANQNGYSVHMDSQSHSSDKIGHIPVLADPIMELFDAKPGMVYLDCTAGRGGHASLVAEKIGASGRVIAFDADPANADFTRERLSSYPCQCDVLHRNFAQVTGTLDELSVDKVDILLADLGFASNQMDDPTRGMTFQADGPLDMRLNPDLPITAEELVNRMGETELADILFQFGEERLSRRIAKKIVQTRDKEPITSTLVLAELVSRCYPPNQRGKRARIHPATRTFMALRIAVNEELMALERLLDVLPQIIKPGGVAAIMSFHSLEDRRVKQRFLQYDQNDCAKRLTRKPIVADDAQIRQNPRSRSAKLRAVQFI